MGLCEFKMPGCLRGDLGNEFRSEPEVGQLAEQLGMDGRTPSQVVPSQRSNLRLEHLP